MALHVCAQELAADHVPQSAVVPGVTVVADGLVALMTLEGEGYALLTY
ncbi:MAG TPA: hypothetical protein VMH86_15740 [Rhizomicrobium sp.]|nr:hypothetical protein [Rhizomicrobium sp.]